MIGGIVGSLVKKMDLGKMVGSGLATATQMLKKAAGEFFKSGFDAAAKSLVEQFTKQLGLPAPSATKIGPPSAPATGGVSALGGSAGTSVSNAVGASASNLLKSDPKEFIRRNMGEEAAAMYDKLPDEQKKEMAMQAAVQRTARISSLMTNMLQTLHDMSKNIIQNTRG